MDWKALKSGRCPKCGKMLFQAGLMLTCSASCGFLIRESRVKEIIADKPKQSGPYRPMSAEENQEFLNNDGYEELAEDFSDSPYLE
jgi:hypothetical protein